MSLNNLKPNSNEVSAFIEEPFFSNMQRFDKYGGIFIPFYQVRTKTIS